MKKLSPFIIFIMILITPSIFFGSASSSRDSITMSQNEKILLSIRKYNELARVNAKTKKLDPHNLTLHEMRNISFIDGKLIYRGNKRSQRALTQAEIEHFEEMRNRQSKPIQIEIDEKKALETYCTDIEIDIKHSNSNQSDDYSDSDSNTETTHRYQQHSSKQLSPFTSPLGVTHNFSPDYNQNNNEAFKK